MILSNDRTKVFFSIPKTGSSTMRALLLPLGTRLGNASMVMDHADRLTFNHIYREQIDPNVTQEQLDAIVGYAFWRDPVDRFKSQSSFARQSKEFYVALYPEYFGEGGPYDLTNVSIPKRFTQTEYSKLPKRIRDIAASIITAESFFQRLGSTSRNLTLEPQWKWFAQPNMVALNYHDFTNEAKRLIGLFGGDPATDIPVINASSDFLPDLIVPDHIHEHIRFLYGPDLAYDPRTPQ